MLMEKKTLTKIEKENCICMYWLEYSEQRPRYHCLCFMPSILFFVESKKTTNFYQAGET